MMSNSFLVGTPYGFESRLVPRSGYRLAIVQGGPLSGVRITEKLKTLWRVGIGIIQARRVLREADSKLVIGIGGYASGATMLAATSLGLRTAIYEANTVPGFTNSLLGRVVDRIYLGFAVAAPAFPPGRTLVTGNPVRPDIVSVGRAERREPYSRGTCARVFVTGGSLGAPFLNRHVPELLRQVADRGL